MVFQIRNYSISPEGSHNETNIITDFTSHSKNYSISPEGEEFPIPEPEEYKEEFKRIKALVDKAQYLNLKSIKKNLKELKPW